MPATQPPRPDVTAPHGVDQPGGNSLFCSPEGCPAGDTLLQAPCRPFAHRESYPCRPRLRCEQRRGGCASERGPSAHQRCGRISRRHRVSEREYRQRRPIIADEVKLLLPPGWDVEGGNENRKRCSRCEAGPAMPRQPASRLNARFRKAVDSYPIESDGLGDILDVLRTDPLDLSTSRATFSDT